MPNWTPPLTENQQKAIAIIPKFTASLSLVGSTFIVVHILRRQRRRVYHRILLGLSAMDIISSFKSFLSTWPIPRGTTYGAVGTTQTCTAAGFFGHGSSLASPLYNGSLTLYYYLTIQYGWKQDRFKRLEPWMHIVPLSIGWATAIAGIPLTLYNAIGWTCWIGPLPLSCKQTYEYGYTTCQRGDNSYIYRWVFFHAFIWSTFLLITIAMILIYRTVRRTETASSRYQINGTSQARKVANQATLYVLAYYLTWIFPIITWTTQLAADQTYTPILFLQAFFVPLQGFFNALVYLRPRYITFREDHPDLGVWQVIRSRNALFRQDTYTFEDTSSARRSNVSSARRSSTSQTFNVERADEMNVEQQTCEMNGHDSVPVEKSAGDDGTQ